MTNGLKRSRAEIISLMTDPGIIAVIRTHDMDQVLAACDALVEGGVIALEITMTTPQALRLIREVSQWLGKKAVVGVGSVLNGGVCRAAIEAGAEFVASPVTEIEIVQAAHTADRPVMLGAYTPTEAQLAYEAGADFVKIFPADKLGPSYIKSLRGPLPHLQIIPTGGVDLKNAADFFKAGCPALGAGSSLLSEEILRTSNWDELTRVARAFVEVARTSRKR